MASYPYIDTLKDTSQFLEVCSGPRCGALGLKILGYAFTREPMLLEIKSLESSVVQKLVHHPELMVIQHDSKPGGLSEPEPPMRRLPGAMADRDALSKPKAKKAKVKVKKVKAKAKPESEQ